MRRYTFYLPFALLTFSICFGQQSVSAQTVSIKTRERTNFQVFCNNANLVSVWDTIKIEFKNYSTENLNKIGGKNCLNLFEVKQATDLNNDGKEEIFVRRVADCPFLINCGLWIFETNKNKYQMIFNAKEIERFSIEKSKSKSYSDIQSRTHQTGTSHYYQSFKFNGKRYTPQKCWWEDSAVPDEKGNFYTLEKPQIRFVKCGK